MTKKKASTRKRSTSKRTSRRAAAVSSLEPIAALTQDSDDFGIQTTGRSVVTFLDTSSSGVKASMAAMKKHVGVKQFSMASDFKKEFSMAEADTADALVFDELGIAVMDTAPDQTTGVQALAASAESNVVVEPEYVNFAFADGLDDDLVGDGAGLLGFDGRGGGALPNQEYLRGYRDALDNLLRQLSGGSEAAAASSDTASSTWGLKATRALSSGSSGRGIRVAVLDTGFDLRHPDFAGRTVRSDSFIPGESVQDRNGHGTHCIGTSCGPEQPGVGPRYGVAFNAEIFVGKVLSNAGSGGDRSILAGINWALRNGCQVISMSLGRPTRPGEQPQTNYSQASARALRAGTLIIAAAGNESNRRVGIVRPVASPANAPAIVAVAAINRSLRIANFSNRAINPSGGEVNFAGPGVDVHSSWPMPIRLRSISGTSMATPHAAGVAALIAQESRAFRGRRLYQEMRRRVRALSLPRVDVGNGLIQA